MTVVHTYFYIVVDTQRGYHTLKFRVIYLQSAVLFFFLFVRPVYSLAESFSFLVDTVEHFG